MRTAIFISVTISCFSFDAHSQIEHNKPFEQQFAEALKWKAPRKETLGGLPGPKPLTTTSGPVIGLKQQREQERLVNNYNFYSVSIQRALNRRGYTIPEDGKFGNLTKDAVCEELKFKPDKVSRYLAYMLALRFDIRDHFFESQNKLRNDVKNAKAAASAMQQASN